MPPVAERRRAPPLAGPYPPYRQNDSKHLPMTVMASSVVLNSVA